MQIACSNEKLRKAARAEKNIMVRAENDRVGRSQRLHLVANLGVGGEQVVALLILWIYEQ